MTVGSQIDYLLLFPKYIKITMDVEIGTTSGNGSPEVSLYNLS